MTLAPLAKPSKTGFAIALGASLIVFAWLAAKPSAPDAASTALAVADDAAPKSTTRDWPLDALPEAELARRAAERAAEMRARMPEGQVPATPRQMATLTPHRTMTAQFSAPSPRIAAPGSSPPPTANPNGVDGARPARPIPGF